MLGGLVAITTTLLRMQVFEVLRAQSYVKMPKGMLSLNISKVNNVESVILLQYLSFSLWV